MGLFDNMRRRQKARQKRRGKRQSARQQRRQTKAEGRFDPTVLAARQAGRQQLMGQALTVGAGLLGQGEALAAYTGAEPEFQETIYVDDGGTFNPMIVWGVVGVAAVLAITMMKK
jgi:hypothetical protein